MITHGCSLDVPIPGLPERHSQRRCGAGRCVLAGERRVWDLNPRELSPVLAVFKTAAIGH